MPVLERVDVNQHRDGQTIVSLRSSDFISYSMTLARGREVEQIDEAIQKLQDVRARIANGEVNSEPLAAG